MLTAWYIGKSKNEGWKSRLWDALIRLGQINERFEHATHCEAVMSGHWAMATIAGASLRDDGVRFKTTNLNPDHWIILSVPAWSRVRSEAWFTANKGQPYSALGAASSASLLVRFVLKLFKVRPSSLGEWCSRALGLSVGVGGAEDMSVSELMALAMALPGTKDVTSQFFGLPVEMTEVRDDEELNEVS